MRRVSFIVLSTILALAVWTGILIAGAVEGWWRRPLAPSGDARAFMDAATAEIDKNRRGNVAFVLIERGTADASPGADGAVRVGIEPGSAFEYSGGGYTLLQLIVEEVSGQSFNDYMRSAVLVPLGMTRSTYSVDGAPMANVAEFYDVDGTPALHYRFTSLAATSLYTSAADLTRFIQAHATGANGEPAGRGVLEPKTLEEMRRPHASQLGADIWGLGTMLYAGNNAGGFVIGHDGNNDPAINTAARVDPETGNGIVVLETGNRVLATTLAGEWLFWRTGNVDFLMLTIEAGNLLKVLGAGGIAIMLTAVIIGWRFRRAAASSPG